MNFTKTLIKWTPQKGDWNVCWRATRDGWASTTFHARCDGKVPTLTIVKVVKNAKKMIFGGYATATWAGNGTYDCGKYSYTSFLSGSLVFL
jgi:hypothetical protein